MQGKRWRSNDKAVSLQAVGDVNDTSDGLEAKAAIKEGSFFIRKVWWAGVAPMKKFPARRPGKSKVMPAPARHGVWPAKAPLRQRQAGWSCTPTGGCRSLTCSMSRPSTVGAISADRDTPSTMMDEAEAVRVGNVSQQRITIAGISAPRV